MSMPGVGAMLHILSGGSPKDPREYYGRKITAAILENDELHIDFEDGTKIRIWDDGQSCCESRYVTCDDDVRDLVDGVLVSIVTEDGGSMEEDWGAHEQAFIKIQTNHICITLTTHNEHNGYYGGFGLSIDEIREGEDDDSDSESY